MDDWEQDKDTEDYIPGFKERDNYSMYGYSSRCTNLNIGNDYKRMQSIANHNYDNPYHIFACLLEAVGKNMTENGISNVSQDDVEIMISYAEYLKNIKAKNPTAFILGYIATKGDKDITKASFDNIKTNVMSKLRDTSVQLPDVIRYARLWSRLWSMYKL